jgi:hypothetical protein
MKKEKEKRKEGDRKTEMWSERNLHSRETSKQLPQILAKWVR